MWQETVILVGIALVLAIVVKAFFLQAFYIPSPSMEPGLVTNDRILVEKVSYWGSASPSRGDIIVFADPGDWLTGAESGGPTNPVAELLSKVGLYPSGGHLVKRVIGVAGDTITCCDSRGRISVNGVPLDEKDYIAPQSRCNGPMIPSCHWSAGPVPAGKLFVMGDNRSNSADSSDHMCTPADKNCTPGDEWVGTDLVVGKVFAVIWPLGHVKFIHRPATFDNIPSA
jgi:signal peptidase I